jgi:hypothetical protein
VLTITRPDKFGARQPAKVTLLHRDVRMLRAQDAQEQPFAGGAMALSEKKRLGDFFPMY